MRKASARHPRRLLALGLLFLTPGCAEDAVLSLFPDCSAGCGTDSTDAGGTTSLATTSGMTDATTGDTSAGGTATASTDTTATDTASTDASTDTTSTTGGAANCSSLAERIRTTQVVLPAAARESTEYYPAIISPRSDATSLLGYRHSSELQLEVLELDAEDQVVRSVFNTPGQEVHALLAHDSGGVLVYVREDSDIFSADFCSQASPCNSLELARFDEDGAVTMTTTLTDKLPVAQEGALFMWWFEHTARIAFADDTYGVYFRSARTLPFPSGPVPRPGDTLRFVDTNGDLLDQGWDFGCVPSWSVRIVHNGVWAAVCHGETPNAHRIVVLDGAEQRELRLLEGVPPAYRALGGLSASGSGFLLSYVLRTSTTTELALTHIESDLNVTFDRVIEEATDLLWEEGYTFRTFHAPLGDDLLLGWLQGTKEDSQLVLARVDPQTEDMLEGPLLSDAPIDHFVEFTPYPNGDVAWAYADADGKISVTRVLGCTEP